MTDFRVSDVPRWQDRLYLRCKYVPQAVLILIALVLTFPLLLVLALFNGQWVRGGLANVKAKMTGLEAESQREKRALGAVRKA